jgi:ATP-dependent Clp protease adaptor protein ClpS
MNVKEKIGHSPVLDDMVEEEHFLILHNDDVHTFDYVIDSLVNICKHEIGQAEQCAYIVHYHGKCDVKKGSYDFLRPMKDRLAGKGLSVTID